MSQENGLDALPPPPPPPPVPVQVISYASPRYASVGAGGVWRDGSLVVLHRSYELPHACVKCGGVPGERPLRQKLVWVPPVAYLGLLAGLLPYAILALCLQKTATVMVPLCEQHRARRRAAIMVVWGLVLGAVLCWVAAGMLSNGWLVAVGIVVLLTGLVYAIVGTKPIRAKKIDDQYIWIKGAGANFMNGLPEARV